MAEAGDTDPCSLARRLNLTIPAGHMTVLAGVDIRTRSDRVVSLFVA